MCVSKTAKSYQKRKVIQNSENYEEPNLKSKRTCNCPNGLQNLIEALCSGSFLTQNAPRAEVEELN